MNFLAHCALAGADPELVVGGFLGDFVKGVVPADLPTGVQAGIRLHRRVDAYSNTQPDIKTSVARFPPALRRVAPVFVDLIADHFLAREFDRHFDESLADFSRRTYAALDAHLDSLPAAARRFRRFVEETDLFERYRHLETVARGFRRIAERLSMPDVDAAGARTFETEYAGLLSDFGRYFPDIREHASGWIASNGAQR
jgi:acyl carrier protein phosphodiesterase